MSDISQSLQQQVQSALADRTPLSITAGNSKSFYGYSINASPLDVREHTGIISYEPTELVITARAGTPLTELESALADKGQCLPFEPPHFADSATLGGTIACNLSGPARPYAGSARDYVLGSHIINGHGELLQFGGEVMKNVAGYDVSRLMCGAMGTLGIVLDVSLKVLPLSEKTVTLAMDTDFAGSAETIYRISSTPAPLTATCFDGKQLLLRFSGTASAVDATIKQLQGQVHDNDFWTQLREQRLPFFTEQAPLWRISIAADVPQLDIPGEWLYEWGNQLRWLKTDLPAEQVHQAVNKHHGHASLFRHAATTETSRFKPLTPVMMQLHRNLKSAFDPENIFNPGKMYPDL